MDESGYPVSPVPITNIEGRESNSGVSGEESAKIPYNKSFPLLVFPNDPVDKVL